MSILTEAARGAPCRVRLPVCNGNVETTVAAHYRSVSLGAGMGIKPNDLLCADACSACHDAIDGRTHIPGYTKDEIRFAHAEGVLRTITARFEKGLIGIGKNSTRELI